MVKITKRDMALLQSLRSNARMSLTQMSRKTKIPISTLFDRLKAQEESTIFKHTTLVKFDTLGFGARVQMALTVEPPKRKALESYLLFHKQVNSLFEVSHNFDFLIEGIFSQVHEVKSFIRDLQEKFPDLRYESHFITRDLKREGFLAQ